MAYSIGSFFEDVSGFFSGLFYNGETMVACKDLHKEKPSSCDELAFLAVARALDSQFESKGFEGKATLIEGGTCHATYHKNGSVAKLFGNLDGGMARHSWRFDYVEPEMRVYVEEVYRSSGFEIE